MHHRHPKQLDDGRPPLDLDEEGSEVTVMTSNAQGGRGGGPGPGEHGDDRLAATKARLNHFLSRVIDRHRLHLTLVLLVLIAWNSGGPDTHPLAPSGGSIYQSGTYRGRPYHGERTLAIETVAETRFARCDVHTVLSEDGGSIIDDWLFLEEVDAVNVAVQRSEGDFVVFRQQKYAIPGETLSPVGGFIDPDESPLSAAKREVLEELGLGSKRTQRRMREVRKDRHMNRADTPLDMESALSFLKEIEQVDPPRRDEYGLLDGSRRVPATEDNDADWVYLGRYRTAANRGGGFVYTFLLKHAVPLVHNGGRPGFVGTGDGESQEILYLNQKDAFRAVSEGRFVEVKWAATFALALLNVRQGMPECCNFDAVVELAAPAAGDEEDPAAAAAGE